MGGNVLECPYQRFHLLYGKGMHVHKSFIKRWLKENLHFSVSSAGRTNADEELERTDNCDLLQWIAVEKTKCLEMAQSCIIVSLL